VAERGRELSILSPELPSRTDRQEIRGQVLFFATLLTLE